MTFHEILIVFMTVQTRSQLEEPGIGNLFASFFQPTLQFAKNHMSFLSDCVFEKSLAFQTARR